MGKKHSDPTLDNAGKSDPTASALRLNRWLDEVKPSAAFYVLADLLPNAAVFVVDKNRDVILWSHGAEGLLGFSADEVLGRFCLTGIRCQNCLARCGLKEYQTISNVPLLLRRASGDTVAVRKFARAFFDAKAQFLGGIEVLVPDTGFQPTAPTLSDLEVLEFHGLITRDPTMRRAIEIVKNVAGSDVTVLVRGQSGTGKELIARAIHLESARKSGPFVAVNCGALTPSLLESELFGHKKGAFTGATSDRPGIFVQADGGTLFLDEVAELPLELQPRLLRVLQEREVVPVGGTKGVPVDIRIVAATHRALREEVKAGRFREDLMYRLRVVPIFLPSLRERGSDIEVLLQQFISRINQKGPRKVDSVAPDALRLLRDHGWPGNVRELQNVVEYALAVGRGPVINAEDLPPEFREPTRASPPPAPSEKEKLEAALRLSHGNLAEAATRLGLSRTTFWRLRKKYAEESAG